MNTLTLKDARLELKTTREAKELLVKAALLDGMDLSAFMMSSAIERARTVLQSHANIALTAQGQARLIEVLQQNLPPTKEMQALRAVPRLKVR